MPALARRANSNMQPGLAVAAASAAMRRHRQPLAADDPRLEILAGAGTVGNLAARRSSYPRVNIGGPNVNIAVRTLALPPIQQRLVIGRQTIAGVLEQRRLAPYGALAGTRYSTDPMPAVTLDRFVRWRYLG